MGSFDRAPSLVGEFRTLRSRIAEMERQRLGVARQQNVWKTAPQSTGGTAPTGAWLLVPAMSLSVDSKGFPLVAYFSASMVSNHFSPGWKRVEFILKVDDAFILESRQVIHAQDNAVAYSVGMIQGLDPWDGAKTVGVYWNVTLQSSGMSTLPNPNIWTEGGVASKSLAVARIGALA